MMRQMPFDPNRELVLPIINLYLSMSVAGMRGLSGTLIHSR
jgi:hypothetical protein